MKTCFPLGCDETNEFGPIHGLEKLVPSSKLRVRYGNYGPFIDDLVMKNYDFPVPFVKLPGGMGCKILEIPVIYHYSHTLGNRIDMYKIRLVEAGLKTIGLEFMPEKDGVPWRVLGCQLQCWLATIMSMGT